MIRSVQVQLCWTVLLRCRLYVLLTYWFNTLRPKQNGRHFAYDISKCIFLNENEWILIRISLKFVPKGLIDNIPALVQLMAWRRPGAKPLSEATMVNLPTHICVSRPRWVNTSRLRPYDHHFADDIFKCDLGNENFWITIEISFKYILCGLIDNMTALIQMMA